MAKANRVSWERESVLDDVFGEGITVVPRHKFVYLSDQLHMCPAVLRTWLEHWREYTDDQNEDLELIMVGGYVVLWRKSSLQKNGGPQALTAALAAAT